MPHPRKPLRLVILAALLAASANTGSVGRSLSPGAFAAVGAQPERGYFSQQPFERVDMVNGNLMLTFTDLVLPGNAGMDLRITRTYNHQNVGPRWTFGFTGVPLRIVEPAQVPPDTWNPRLLMSDGSEQPLHAGVVSGYFVTTDFWRYHAGDRKLYLPNGWVASYGSDGWARLVKVEDQYGNSMTPAWTEYTTGFWRITSVEQNVSDSGATRTRTVNFSYQDGNNPTLPTSVAYGERTWNYQYQGFSVMTHAEPPEGPDWEFAYNLSGNDGTLTVTTPSGGTVEYEFDEQDLGGLKSVVRELSTGGRAVTSGTWSFDYAVNVSTATSSVTTPLGREISFEHLYRSGPNGFEWTLEARALSNGQASMVRTYTSTPFTTGLTLNAIDEQTITQDGVTFTTNFDYSSSDFGDHRHPSQITESASNHSATRVTTRSFDHTFGAYIIGRVTSTTVAIGSDSVTATASYNQTTGFLESQTASGLTTTFGPDSFGNVGTVTDAHNHQTTTSHKWGVAESIATPEYTITRSVNADGTVQSETRNGKTTVFEYDSLGRVTLVTPALGTAIETTFASDASTTTVTRGSSWTTTTVDGFGRPIATENVLGIKTSANLDEEGFRTFQSAPFTGSSGTGNTFAYDALGRITSITHADSSDVTYSYSGTSLTITDENNHSTTQHWQMFGSPGGGRLTGLTDADGKAWAYGYDAAGNLRDVDAPAGPNRTWTYTNNLLTAESHPESGTTTYSYTGGLLTGRTDARGQSFSYAYDGNHRLVQISAPVSAETVTFEYDDSDNQTRMAVGGLETLFTYDNANRLSGRDDRINGQSFTTAYEFDDRDNLTKITYPSGRIAQYLYDSGNRVTKVYAGSTTYAENLAYHPTGAMTAAAFGNGQSESLTLNSRFRPEHLVSGPLDVTYGYDAAGNVSSIDDARSGFDSSYGYDALDRLTNVSGFGATSFTFDELGNRLTKGSGSTQVTYAYSATTHRLSTATSSVSSEAGTFTYDNTGNMTADGTGTYTYSARNMMRTAALAGTTTTYDYDPAGLRAVKSAPGSVRYFVRGLGSQVLAEYDATSGTPWLAREYVYLGSRLLASFAETVPSATISTHITAPLAGTVSASDVPLSLAADASVTGGGSISSVQFYANGMLIGADSSAPYTVSWTPTAAGTFKLTSRALASTGKVANSVPVTVTVTAIGRVLGVSTSPTSPIEGQPTTIEVTGNAYACGAVQVNFGDGSSQTYTHTGALASSPLQVTHLWTSAGSKTVTAAGQGDCQGAAQTTATVTGNTGPTVSFTAPSAGIYTTGTTITMTASASDPQGVAFVAFYSAGTLLHADYTAPYSFSWTATEGAHELWAYAFDTYNANDHTWFNRVFLTVQDVQSIGVSPSPPVVGQAAVVTVYGSATDCGAVQVNYGDGHVETYAIDGLPISNYHAWTTGGTKTITATGQGNCSGSVQTTVTLNVAPTVTLTTPAHNDFFAAPATVSLAATASDSDGSIASVKFYAGTTLLATDTTSPYSYAWSGMSNATYSITAVATDNQGSTTTSTAASINVGTPPASTVTGVSVSASSVSVNTSVTVTVTGGNPCGAVQINFGDGNAPYLPIYELPYQTTHSWSSPGTYTITASGQGNCSGQSSTQITITSEDEAPGRPGVSGSQDALARGVDSSDRASRVRAVEAVVEGDGEVPLIVSFADERAAPVTVTLDLVVGANGTVTSSPSGFNCTGNDTTCTVNFEAGTVVTLTATPASGQVFRGWGGACAGTSTTCQITATSGQLVTATFGSASSGTISYYHTDVLGSVRAITNASGGTVTRHDYFPFGESTSALTGDPRRFAQLELDAETAFDYAEARYYRNVWGRFTSADPGHVNGSLEDSQSWNAYAYGRNNPLRFVDTSGLEYEVWNNFNHAYSYVENSRWESDLAWMRCNCTSSSFGGWTYIYEHGKLDYVVAYRKISEDGPKRDPFAPLKALEEAGERADKGVQAALVIASPNFMMVAVTLAPVEGFITVGRLVGSRSLNEAIGLAQRTLLREFFRTGRLPPGLDARSLRLYREIAVDAIKSGKDTIGVQAQRVKLIDAVLRTLK